MGGEARRQHDGEPDEEDTQGFNHFNQVRLAHKMMQLRLALELGSSTSSWGLCVTESLFVHACKRRKYEEFCSGRFRKCFQVETTIRTSVATSAAMPTACQVATTPGASWRPIVLAARRHPETGLAALLGLLLPARRPPSSPAQLQRAAGPGETRRCLLLAQFLSSIAQAVGGGAGDGGGGGGMTTMGPFTVRFETSTDGADGGDAPGLDAIQHAAAMEHLQHQMLLQMAPQVAAASQVRARLPLFHFPWKCCLPGRAPFYRPLQTSGMRKTRFRYGSRKQHGRSPSRHPVRL